jgi:hypothetical protein
VASLPIKCKAGERNKTHFDETDGDNVSIGRSLCKARQRLQNAKGFYLQISEYVMMP